MSYALLMKTKRRSVRMAKNPWNLPKPTNGAITKKEILTRGQMLLVDVTAQGYDYIPCFPKPGAEKTTTRILNGTWIIYLGTLEFAGVPCFEFVCDESKEVFYIGTGVLPYLVNIPKKPEKEGFPFKKKSGSKVGISGFRRKKRKLDRGLVNLASPPQPETK
jgi:hypothetical protein